MSLLLAGVLLGVVSAAATVAMLCHSFARLTDSDSEPNIKEDRR